MQKIDLGLTGYDELFMNDAERKENKLPRIYDVPISEIDDFPDHPFKVKVDEDMSRTLMIITVALVLCLCGCSEVTQISDITTEPSQIESLPIKDSEESSQETDAPQSSVDIDTPEESGIASETTVSDVKDMKCSCGCKFNQRGWNHHNGADEMAFQCYSKLAHGSVTERKKRGLPTKDTCTTPIIPKWKMELIAHEIFTKHFTDISAVTELACKMIEEHINDVEDVEDNTEIIAQKNAEIEKLERKKVGLIEMRADGDIERDYFLTRKDEVEKQIEHLQQEIQELTPIDTRQKKEDLVERLEALKQKLSEYTDFENTLIIPDGVIEAFTEQIIASDKGFDWYLKAVPDMVKSFMDDTPDDETEKEWHELTQFDLTIEDAKAYVYSFSSRRRVHGWQNIKIRLFV